MAQTTNTKQQNTDLFFVFKSELEMTCDDLINYQEPYANYEEKLQRDKDMKIVRDALKLVYDKMKPYLEQK